MSRFGDLLVRDSATRFRRGFGLILVAVLLALLVPLSTLLGVGVVDAIGWGTLAFLVAGMIALLGVVFVMQGVVELAANLDLMTLAVVTEMSHPASGRVASSENETDH